jgi:hypothetical protein
MSIIDLVLYAIDRISGADKADALARRNAQRKARESRDAAKRARAAAARLGRP